MTWFTMSFDKRTAIGAGSFHGSGEVKHQDDLSRTTKHCKRSR